MAEQVLRAVASGIIRLPGGRRAIVKKGVTTAHKSSEVVASDPKLWAPIRPDFPSEGRGDSAFDDAVQSSGLVFAQAVRDLIGGLYDKGYTVPEGPDEDLAARVVRVALNNIPPAGAAVNEVAYGPVPPEGTPTSHGGATESIDDAELAGQPSDGDEPAGPDSTPEGRKAIREWAEDHGYEVSPHGKIPAEVVAAYVADQG